MRKTFLALSLVVVLSACNGSGSKESAVASDSTQVADTLKPLSDTTVKEAVDTLK